MSNIKFQLSAAFLTLALVGVLAYFGGPKATAAGNAVTHVGEVNAGRNAPLTSVFRIDEENGVICYTNGVNISCATKR